MRKRFRPLPLMIVAVLTGVLVAPGAAQADYVRDGQWWLGPLRIEEAQKISKGQGVVVGIIDTPVDASRPELRGRVAQGKGFDTSDPAEGIDDAAGASHGTEIAGIIAGRSPDRNGFLGVAPEARVLPYGTYQRTSEVIVSGLRWLTDQGVKVINISRGGLGAPSAAEVDAVNYAIGHDVVVVVSAGNREGSGASGAAVMAPANVPGVIAVSGIGKSGDFAPESSRGPEVVLAAPGVSIVAPAPVKAHDTGYGLASGTSASAAIVSGVAALIRSKYPKMNAANVIERLIRTSRDNGDKGRDQYFGFGTVRPFQALTDDVPTVQKSSLGLPVEASAPSTAQPDAASPGEPQSGLPVRLVIVGALVALFILVLVLVLVLVSRRKNRRPTQPYPASNWQGPPTGYPPQNVGYPGAPPRYPPQQTGHPGQSPGYAPPQADHEGQPGFPDGHAGYRGPHPNQRPRE